MPCAVDGVSRDGRPASRRDAAGRGACAVAGRRDRRPHGAEDRRDAVRLPHRRAVRPARSCRRGRRWCRSRSRPDAARALRRPVGRVGRRRGRAAAAARFRENLLFTHRGLSGPAILQISSYWDGRDAAVDRPAARTSTRARGWRRSAASDGAARQRCSRERLPRRFAQQWCAGARRRRGRCAQLGETRLRRRRARAARLAACCRRARSATTRPRSRWAASTRAALSSKTMAARERARPVLHRRGRRRHRLARRLQLPVGVGVGPRGGRGGVMAA